MKKVLFSVLLLALAVCAHAQDLHIVSTGDVHGSYFSRSYVGDNPRNSLMSVKYYVDSLRAVAGPENVLLLDAGDCLQGDNASYYFNYVATDKPHIYPRIAAYMGYDACTVGNHDIEAGHPVYDKVREELEAYGIPWLAGNAFKDDGSCYFQEYKLIEKGGRRILVAGYNNANIDGWLSEDLWRGMRHKSLVPLVRKRIQELRRELKPDVVVVVLHSGTGKGDGRSIESQGLDVFKFIKGVDVLVTAHDHQPACIYANNGKSWLINGGARCSNVGHAVLHFEGGKVKAAEGEIKRIDRSRVDQSMEEAFRPEFEAVKAFTMQPVGMLDVPLETRDAYSGMCNYIDLLHTVQLAASGAQISIAAPLTFNGHVSSGQLVYNDMFTIYPFENQLYVLKLSGRELKALLEYSYDHWIRWENGHVLFIKDAPDARTGAVKWSFVNRSYNFDSAAGINYTVDVRKPLGERVTITSLADGTPFDENAAYSVAMTSYRANGGGSLLTMGAGIKHAKLTERIIARYPEIRDLLYKFISEKESIGPSQMSDRAVLGSWRFVPEELVEPLMKKDIDLVF
ncbi:MAG: bifunctional metallophosphatase/5'-nucleotidase [Bacteroidales bacterium]|nr:bifunctional metallophosphatase/5'-nucleotidase [Bacteroidales bacterium]